MNTVVAVNQSAAMTIYSQTQSASVGGTAILTFTDALPAASDATLSLIATGGELAFGGKRLEQLTVDGDTHQTLGSPAGWIIPVIPDGADPVTIPLALLNGYVADGEVEVFVFKPNFISGGTFDLVLEYTSSVPEPASGFLLLAGMVGFGLFRQR